MENRDEAKSNKQSEINEKIEELLEDLTCEGEDCGDCAIREDCKSPRVIRIIRDQEAEINRLQAALDAQKAIQKPLTLKEVYREQAVWVEEQWNESVRPGLITGERLFHVHVKFEYSEDDYIKARYGADWRCWAMKPSDEERMAAEWEE